MSCRRPYDGGDDTMRPSVCDDDWFLSFRFAMNDTEDATILRGAIIDASGTFAVLEPHGAWVKSADSRWKRGCSSMWMLVIRFWVLSAG